MNFQCPFCPRTFSQRSAYSQHTQICLRKAEVDEEESNSETHSIDLTQDVNESDDNELMEYKPFQEAAQDTSFSSMESTYSNLLSDISIMSYEENIEKRRTFMNKMKFSNLSFNKICITYHNGKEYFLHYQSLIQCIENILAVPDITQNFALSFENYEHKGESVYKEQNNGIWWKNTEGSLPTGAKLLLLIL